MSDYKSMGPNESYLTDYGWVDGGNGVTEENAEEVARKRFESGQRVRDGATHSVLSKLWTLRERIDRNARSGDWDVIRDMAEAIDELLTAEIGRIDKEFSGHRR